MAADYVTLDLDIFLDEEKLHALELAANQAVQRNLPTRVQVVDGADLAGMTLRKKAAGLNRPGTHRLCGGGGFLHLLRHPCGIRWGDRLHPLGQRGQV